MISFLRKLMGQHIVDGTEPDEDNLTNQLCPKCKCSKFQEGPSGGLSRNIRCENGHCWWVGLPGAPNVEWKFIGLNTDGIEGYKEKV